MAICNAVGLFLLVDGVLVGLAGVTAPPFGNVVCREHGGDPERREGGGNGEAEIQSRYRRVYDRSRR